MIDFEQLEDRDDYNFAVVSLANALYDVLLEHPSWTEDEFQQLLRVARDTVEHELSVLVSNEEDRDEAR